MQSLQERDGGTFAEEEETQLDLSREDNATRPEEALEQVLDTRRSEESVRPEGEMVTSKRKTSLSKSLHSLVHRNRKSSSSSITSGSADVPSKRSNSTSSAIAPSKASLVSSSLHVEDSALSIEPVSPVQSESAASERRLATDPAPLALIQQPSLSHESKRRRPSLPSILERAAHQIAHPHRHSQSHQSPPPFPPSTLTSAPLARAGTFDTFLESDRDSVASSSRRKFSSNRSLLRLFTRDSKLSSRFGDDGSTSPPSASPSPPSSAIDILPLDEEDLDRTIDAIRRQSFEGVQITRAGSLDLDRTKSVVGLKSPFASNPSSPTRRTRALHPPSSAAASRTSFFPPISSSSPARSTNSNALSTRSYSQSSAPSPDLSESSATGPSSTPWYRSRKGSEPACPSPLGLGRSISRRNRLSKRSVGSKQSTGSRSGGSEDEARFPNVDYSDDDDEDAMSSAFSNTSSPYFNPNRPPSFTPWTSSSGVRSPSYTGYTTGSSSSHTTNALPTSSNHNASIGSNISSLRKVASANLRRETATVTGEGDPYGGRTRSYEGEETEMGDGEWRSRERDQQRHSNGFDHALIPDHSLHHSLANSSSRKAGLLVSATTRASRSRGTSFSSSFSVSPSASAIHTPPSQPADLDQLPSDAHPPELNLGPSIFVSPTSPPRVGGGRSRSSSVNSNASGRGGGNGGPNGGVGGAGTPNAGQVSFATADRLSSGAHSTSSSGVPTIPSVPEDPSPSSSSHHLSRPLSRSSTNSASASSSISPGSYSSHPYAHRRV